jgi:hypothetical protein
LVEALTELAGRPFGLAAKIDLGVSRATAQACLQSTFRTEVDHAPPSAGGKFIPLLDRIPDIGFGTHGGTGNNSKRSYLHKSHERCLTLAEPPLHAGIQNLVAGAVPAELLNQCTRPRDLFLVDYIRALGFLHVKKSKVISKNLEM